jgi:cell division protein FtsZ
MFGSESFESSPYNGLNPTRIKVIGVGGGGSNAVNQMVQDGIDNVDVFAVNTDLQHLSRLSVPNKIQIGEKVTRGLGAGSNPEIGEQAAYEDVDKIKEVLKDTDMLFIAVGLGGGTGTGAAPVIAQVAKEMGILTVGVATLPFKFEHRVRKEIALKGLEKLKEHVDTYIIIHNDRVSQIANKMLTFKDAFREVDSVLSRVVRGVTNTISTYAVINIDFADVKTIMENGGLAVIGMGEGRGEGKIETAVQQAISNPLLEGNSIEGARRLLLTLWVSEDVPYAEVEEAISTITEQSNQDPLVIFGAALEEDDEDLLKVTVIATDFDRAQEVQKEEQATFKVIKRESPEIKKAIPEENLQPVEPDDSLPAYLRRKRRI